MYLTGGQYKGRKIEVPNNVKPTLSKVRESIFNMLQSFEFSDKSFLDMCSGSGIMGLEAISRGYIVTSLEINPKVALIIKKTYESIGIKPNLIITDCLKYKTDKKFEIIYLDPPWGNDYEQYILKADELLENKGILIIEFDKENPVEIENIIKNNKLALNIVKSKKYGRCLICLLQKILQLNKT